MKNVLLLFVSLLFLTNLSAQKEYKFRVWIKNKSNTSYSLARPLEFLSQKSIDRRIRQNIAIDSADIPVSANYINQLTALGLKKMVTSKWQNSVVVSTSDSSLIHQIRNKSFVDSVKCVWKMAVATRAAFDKSDVIIDKGSLTPMANAYGYGLPQLSISNGYDLHEMGFRGEGKTIAIIDAGFLNSKNLSIYKNTHILGTKDFVTPGGDVYQGDRHGQMVLSVMAAVDSMRFIGAAPNANYWLFRTEDSNSEYPVEEDYWTAAAEYADSVGVDLINTSLGYSQFDDPSMNYRQSQLDGKTAFVTKAAQIASNKGILVVVSAGNEGNKPWQKINFPADAKDVLAIGAITINLQVSAFSSYGYSADGRVKPDVLSVGEGTFLYDNYGTLSTSSGTSFSAPLMTGMLACLWQALPNQSNKELIDLLRSNSSKALQPDTHAGFGIPNIAQIVQLQNNLPVVKNDQPEIYFKNKSGSRLSITHLPDTDSVYTVYFYNEIGKKVQENQVVSSGESIIDTRFLKRGMHIVFISGNNRSFTKKIIK